MTQTSTSLGLFPSRPNSRLPDRLNEVDLNNGERRERNPLEGIRDLPRPERSDQKRNVLEQRVLGIASSTSAAIVGHRNCPLRLRQRRQTQPDS